MAPEGHRNYPLRELKELRRSAELLLPIAPFLDEWGALLAVWPGFSPDERANIVGGLITGCRKVEGQQGYYRALAGFDRLFPGGLDSRDLAAHLGSRVRADLKDATLRKKIAVRRESFESSCAKAACPPISRSASSSPRRRCWVRPASRSSRTTTFASPARLAQASRDRP